MRMRWLIAVLLFLPAMAGAQTPTVTRLPGCTPGYNRASGKVYQINAPLTPGLPMTACDSNVAGFGPTPVAGSGTNVTLDLGNNGSNESTAVNKVTTTGDTNSIFTEPNADELRIALGNDWPKADLADALAANGGNCGAGLWSAGVDAAGVAEGCTADDDTPESGDFGNLIAGAGLTISSGTLATASTESNFLASSTLVCGAGTAGKVTVDAVGTPLAYCDASGVLQYAAYSTLGNGVANSAAALSANGSNCSAGSTAGGVDAAGAAESCIDPIVSTEIDTSAELAAILGDETGSGGGFVRSTGPSLSNPIVGGYVELTGATSGRQRINAAAVAGAGSTAELPAGNGIIPLTSATPVDNEIATWDGTAGRIDTSGVTAASGVITFGASTGDKVVLYPSDYGLGINSFDLAIWSNDQITLRNTSRTGTVIATANASGLRVGSGGTVSTGYRLHVSEVAGSGNDTKVLIHNAEANKDAVLALKTANETWLAYNDESDGQHLKLASDTAVIVDIDTDADPILLSSSDANNTAKVASIGLRHYAIAEEPNLFIGGHSSSTSSQLFIGGGDSDFNAFEEVRIYTAANTTTPTGTMALGVNDAQQVVVGSTLSGIPSGPFLYVAGLIQNEQATIGNEVLHLESTATNDDPNYIVRSYRGTTTDATQTTIATIATTSSNSYLVEARVVAHCTGGSSCSVFQPSAGYVLIGSWVNASGTAVQNGSTLQDFVGEQTSTWDATLAASSGDVLLKVTGAANYNITWHATVIIQNVNT